MPFLIPWTDADPRYLGRGSVQHFWQQRSALAPEDWNVHFLIRHEGRVIGVQSLHAREFGIVREVSTGSWLGLAHQGRGFGTEMRAAVLMLAFDHLGAVCARSGAFADNAASQRVSAKLGYAGDGSTTHVRRGEPAEEVRLRLTPAAFVRPPWTLQVEGLAGCLGLLGAG
jgi:RimJ/RimL family protein N-acetyltransferase